MTSLEANVKVNFSLSLAGVLGPGIAGLLVQLIAAPFAVALDALSFLISALFIRGIARDEPPAPTRSQRSVLAEIGEGLRQVYSHPLLRPMAICLALHFFSMSVRIAVYLIYLLRTLQITPGWLGVVLAGYGPGALLWHGAHPAARATVWYGRDGARWRMHQLCCGGLYPAYWHDTRPSSSIAVHNQC